jgi:hypothetical protein
VWSTVWACIKPVPIVVEFVYFVGLAGAGMALLTGVVVDHFEN